jgi:YHS domain-containing protein
VNRASRPGISLKAGDQIGGSTSMKTRRAIRASRAIMLAAFATVAVSVSAPAVLADKPQFYSDFFSDIAVGGYDAVAYFKEGRPVKGEKAFSTRHKGAEFRFATKANLDAFLKQPDAYTPQYGGYCAWAASQGYTAKGDPKHWKIVNGRLYLNYDGNIQKKWEVDIPGFIAKADTNWPQILK